MSIYHKNLFTPVNALRSFLKLESTAGVLLVAATVLALLVSNSPLAGAYERFLAIPIVVAFGDLSVAKPLAYPSDDAALMAATRVGVLAGSLLSAVVGYTILRMCAPADDQPQPAAAGH